MAGQITTVEAYLETLPEEKRICLEEFRARLMELVPEATEVITYGMPGLRLYNRGLVAYAAAKQHCSLHLMSKLAMATHRKALTEFSTTIASIHFTRQQPIPQELLERLIRTRVEENRALADAKKRKKKQS